MRSILAFVMACGICVPAATAQPAAPPDAAPEALVKLWFERWNALTEATETHEALAALYAPDGLHLTGPDADQRGTATFRGPDGVRALAARIVASEEKRVWRIDTDTAREATAQLLHVTTGPWGRAGGRRPDRRRPHRPRHAEALRDAGRRVLSNRRRQVPARPYLPW